ncbi:MAG: ABC transporter permease [Erysipelotrichaceae bacterium]|nr:ABC transporter permease [Erysipelotrichaceae bacterium]
MNKILTIIKKELKRFFTDRRMMVSLILPGVLIFVIYSLLGNFMADAFLPSEDYQYVLYQKNVPNTYKTILDESEFNITYFDQELSMDEIKDKIKNGEITMYIEFEENFEEKVANNLQPKITLLYDSSIEESNAIFSYYSSALLQLGTTITYSYLINSDANEKYDLATNEDFSTKIITMLLPYLLLIFLFTGCVSISTESIAGEKERGTLSTLLVTPTKRSYIALGKIIALSITSLVSALSSFLGLILSLPKLMGGATDITLSMYGIGVYIQLFVIIILTLLLFTTLLSIISTLAKNVKEASQWSSFLMVFITLLGISSLINMGNVSTNLITYIIPIYNIIQCMSAIVALKMNLIAFIITVVSNVLYIALGVYLLTKLFNSEKIMSTN